MRSFDSSNKHITVRTPISGSPADMSTFQIETATGLIEKLAALPLFDSIEPNLLRAIAAEFDWFSLPVDSSSFARATRTTPSTWFCPDAWAPAFTMTKVRKC